MENVYFSSFRNDLFSEREFMIHMLFLFLISALVTREIMVPPKEIFSSSCYSIYMHIYIIYIIYIYIIYNIYTIYILEFIAYSKA